MSHKDTAFYRGRTAISFDFSAEEISSDGAVLLLDRLERKHKLINYYSSLIPDSRHPLRIVHSIEKLLKQQVFMFIKMFKCLECSTPESNFSFRHFAFYKHLMPLASIFKIVSLCLKIFRK